MTSDSLLRRFGHPRVQWFPRDLWVGVFIGEREPNAEVWCRRVYVCPVPCVVFSVDVLVERAEPCVDCRQVECYCDDAYEAQKRDEAIYGAGYEDAMAKVDSRDRA